MSKSLSRRELLSLGAGGAALAGCVADAASHDGSPQPISEHVVVVGAGLAGLVCAYRLRKAEVQAAVYEAGSRIGGRLYTRKDLFPGFNCELGAEFLANGDETMLDLADELDIDLDPVQDSGPTAQEPDYRERVYWLAGTGVTEAMLEAQLAAVTPAMVNALAEAEDDDAGRELDGTSLGAWFANNVPSDTYPELSRLLTAAFRAELGLDPDRLSAFNLWRLFDEDEIPTSRLLGLPLKLQERHRRVREGCGEFARRLEQEIQKAGDPIELESRLVALRSVDGHYVLTFETPNGGFEVEATHVVLAIPFSTLREVDLDGVELPEDKRALIAELGYGTSCKLVGAFTLQIWKEFHHASGDTLSDGISQHVWDSTYRSMSGSIDGGVNGLLTSQQGGSAGASSGTRDPDQDFLAVLAELDQVFPPPPPAGGATLASVLVDESAVRVHWPSSPLARGSNPCALPGQWQKLGIASRREGNLHFCGDHCSVFHLGRMEGAARSGNDAAEEVLEDLRVLSTPPAAGQVGALALRPTGRAAR